MIIMKRYATYMTACDFMECLHSIEYEHKPHGQLTMLTHVEPNPQKSYNPLTPSLAFEAMLSGMEKSRFQLVLQQLEYDTKVAEVLLEQLLYAKHFGAIFLYFLHCSNHFYCSSAYTMSV